MKLNLLRHPLKNMFIPIFVILGVILINQKAFAEGTKQVSPSSASITSLYFAPLSPFGSGFNVNQKDRIYFHISDHNTENLYFGGNFRTRGSATTLSDVYYRIKNSSGTVIVTATSLSSSITSYAQAVAGPNIGGTNPSGYSPTTFNPTANGDYYIEIYRSSDAGASNNTTGAFIAPWFDFSVGTSAGVVTDGRVFSENWSFVATKPTDNFAGTFVDPVSPTLYTYTNDQTVVKVVFNNFKPLAFIPAFNSYGVNSSESDWYVGRKSVNTGTSSPSLINSFKTFLNTPDASVYNVASLAAAPSLNGNIQGCAGAYLIPYYANVNGDVKFLLDINGISGFQSGSTDRILEALNITAGNNLMPWDGKDGLGNTLSPNTNVSTKISMLRGRINLPLFDAEFNENGFVVSSVAPSAVDSLVLFWDDHSLVNLPATPSNNSNITGAGIDNSLVGQKSPGHAWNGVYGSSLIIPPALPGGTGTATPDSAKDDFGNVRTINTWFWGLEEQSGDLSFRLPYCLDISGNVFHDTNGLNNSLIDGTGTNFGGGLYAYLINGSGDIIAKDTVNSDGSYIFHNVDSGIFTVLISKNSSNIGSPAPAISLPSGYSSIGEGTVATGDGNPSGDTQITVTTSNITGVNFGLNQNPNSNNKTLNIPNPSGSNTTTSPSLDGYH